MSRSCLLLGVAFALASCSTTRSESGALTDFVVDLVANQTSDTAEPAQFERFASLPDPDGEANSLEAYSTLF